VRTAPFAAGGLRRLQPGDFVARFGDQPLGLFDVAQRLFEIGPQTIGLLKPAAQFFAAGRRVRLSLGCLGDRRAFFRGHRAGEKRATLPFERAVEIPVAAGQQRAEHGFEALLQRQIQVLFRREHGLSLPQPEQLVQAVVRFVETENLSRLAAGLFVALDELPRGAVPAFERGPPVFAFRKPLQQAVAVTARFELDGHFGNRRCVPGGVVPFGSG
jgi:hypothetical protein